MKRQRISGIYADASAFDGQMITVCGWARTIRDSKHFGFIELNDGTRMRIPMTYSEVYDYWSTDPVKLSSRNDLAHT